MTAKAILLWLAHNAGALIVIVGLATEFVAELKRFSSNERLKKRISKIGVLVIILGIAVEIYESARIGAQLAKAIELAGEANERAAQLGKEAEQLKKQNLELYRRIQPRSISRDQRTKILESLKNAPKGTISTSAFSQNEEAMNFLTQIQSVLSEAGFTLVTNVWMAGGASGTGMAFISKTITPAPPPAFAVFQAFTNAGIFPTHVEAQENLAVDLRIVVVSKPW